MGQKVNPHGLRVGIIKDWDSRWLQIRALSAIPLLKITTFVSSSRRICMQQASPRLKSREQQIKSESTFTAPSPGQVIGRGGEAIEKLRAEVEKMIGKPVNLNIFEIKSPDLNAQLVAEKIAADLENRVSFRRAMKSAIGRAMKLGAKGIKIKASGRLGGAEIARSESYHEGTIPLQTIRADIDYGTAEAATTYGRIGVKVWIYKGEILKGELPKTEEKPDRRPRRPRNGDDRPRRREGNFGGRIPSPSTTEKQRRR